MADVIGEATEHIGAWIEEINLDIISVDELLNLKRVTTNKLLNAKQNLAKAKAYFDKVYNVAMINLEDSNPSFKITEKTRVSYAKTESSESKSLVRAYTIDVEMIELYLQLIDDMLYAKGV